MQGYEVKVITAYGEKDLQYQINEIMNIRDKEISEQCKEGYEVYDRPEFHFKPISNVTIDDTRRGIKGTTLCFIIVMGRSKVW